MGSTVSIVLQLEPKISSFAEMEDHGGFSFEDYDVLTRSCNIFTAEVTKRLNMEEHYPTGILSQSRVGRIFSPILSALDARMARSMSAASRHPEEINFSGS